MILEYQVINFIRSLFTAMAATTGCVEQQNVQSKL